jgi:hypothetical protein
MRTVKLSLLLIRNPEATYPGRREKEWEMEKEGGEGVGGGER